MMQKLENQTKENRRQKEKLIVDQLRSQIRCFIQNVEKHNIMEIDNNVKKLCSDKDKLGFDFDMKTADERKRSEDNDKPIISYIKPPNDLKLPLNDL